MTGRERSEVCAVGADGCRQGWVAVVLRDGVFDRAHLYSTFAALRDAEPDAHCLGVDMPIGFVDRGEREADAAARAFLGRRRGASVFSAPPRPALHAPDWASAMQRAREASGKGLTKQTYNLGSKMREVDSFVADERIFEVHPEVSFGMLGGGPFLHSKKTWGGQAARRRALVAAGIELPDALGDADVAAPDDVLDAAVVAWSAHRIATGQARTFPRRPRQRDRSGRLIAIWA